MANILGKKALCDIAYGTPLSTKCVKLVPSLKTKRLTLSEITEEDAQVIMDLRNDPEVFTYFLNPHALELEEHLKWFHNTYEKDPDRFDWLGRDENGKVMRRKLYLRSFPLQKKFWAVQRPLQRSTRKTKSPFGSFKSLVLRRRSRKETFTPIRGRYDRISRRRK